MAEILNIGSRVATLGDDKYWARNGFIQIDGPSGHKTITVKEGLLRANALSEMLKNSAEKDLIKYSETRAKISSFLSDFVEVCRIAREQGMFGDESMMRSRARALPTSISVPKSFSSGLD